MLLNQPTLYKMLKSTPPRIFTKTSLIMVFKRFYKDALGDYMKYIREGAKKNLTRFNRLFYAMPWDIILSLFLLISLVMVLE